jgi:serine/threonine-protein kinase RsbW
MGESRMPRLRIYADLPELSRIRDFVVQAGHELGLDERSIADLELVVDEACSNIIRHGYGGQGGPIEVLVQAAAGGVRVIVRDWAPAFDPHSVPWPDVTAPLEERPLGGLGLFLIHRLMDDVQFHFDAANGNTLTMAKRSRLKTGGIHV